MIQREIHQAAETFTAKTSNGAEWMVVLAFCLIGFLITLNAMLRFPDFVALIAQSNQF